MSVNKALIVGYVGRDPEVRYTKDGKAVANFSVATSDAYTDAAGAKRENTEWHNVVAWEKVADFAQKYLKKGSCVYVEGKLKTSDWTDKENVKHYKTEIVAAVVRFVGGNPNKGKAEPQGNQQSSGNDDFVDDDIPF